MTLEERTLQVWRAVCAAGVAGIGITALRDNFSNVIDGEVVTAKVQSLQRGGYIARKGENRWGLWMIDKDCKVPEGEVAPVWLHEPDDESEAHAYGWAVAQGKTEVKLPALPASVFNHERGLNWTPPAREPSLRQQIAAKGQAAVGQFESALNINPVVIHEGVDEEAFLCYVDSDGGNYILSNGRHISLPAEDTRKLMRYFALINAASMLIEPAGASA